MNSTLKTVLPIALVVLMVFGITFMTQFTADTPSKAPTEVDNVAPIQVGNSERYVGYFEVGTTAKENRVGFFIRNARPSGVFLTALTPSCSVCTSADAAVIPPDAFATYLQQSAAGSLWFPTPPGNLLSAVSWVQTRQKVAWHHFEFANAKNRLELPAASESTGQTWALLELGFDMKDAAVPRPRSAYFDVYDAKDQKLLPQPFTFNVMAGGREAQELIQSDYNVGTLTDSHPDQVVEVLCVSALRDQLPKPVVAIGNTDPHVKVSEAEPIDRARLDDLSQKASSGPTTARGETPPIFFRSGYSYRITVSRDAKGKALDVGPFDKEVFISGGPGIVLKRPLRVHMEGTVVGAIQLEGVSKIDFGSYDSTFAQKKDVRLWTEKKGIELEVVPQQTEPNFLKVTLAQPTVEAGRTYWAMNVQIPAREGKRPPWDGIIFLRTKGENPVNVRVQVSGHGR